MLMEYGVTGLTGLDVIMMEQVVQLIKESTEPEPVIIHHRPEEVLHALVTPGKNLILVSWHNSVCLLHLQKFCILI